MLSIFSLIRQVHGKIPARFNVAVMMFMACFVAYMLRVNISIIIIAMVKPSNQNGNDTEIADHGPRYEWSKHDESLVLGGYFWGYLMTSLIGGVLAERFGGTHVIGISSFLSGFFTVISPCLSNDNFWYIFIARFLLGAMGGVCYPALHNLVSKWAPPDEKGKFVSCLLGGAFGTVVTWMISGVIIEEFGWDWAFYTTGIITFIFVLFWYILVSDSPAKHKRIKKEEVEYIQKSLADTVSHEKTLLPVTKILTSVPFYALLLLHYGSLWGLYFLLTAAPKFMNEVLGFNLAKAGFLSSLPYLARLLSGFGFGAIGDFIRRKEILKVTAIRKIFCVFSHIIPGLLLMTMKLAAVDPYICVAVVTLSLGFNGAATITNLQNSQDLAPNFAGSIYGIINFVGTTSGFISPMIVASITHERSTIEEWQYIFYIGAFAYIAPAVLFAFIGSGKIQSWNDKADKKENRVENAS